jgi:hypothetical protein
VDANNRLLFRQRLEHADRRTPPRHMAAAAVNGVSPGVPAHGGRKSCKVQFLALWLDGEELQPFTWRIPWAHL